MRRWIPFAIYLGLAAITAAVALAGVGGQPRARAAALTTSGDFSISNSKEGMPLIAASDIGPGGSAQGTVEIANTGDVASELLLEGHDPVDTPGPGGGLLSSRLRLRVEDVTHPISPALVYVGPLDAMPAQRVGRLGPGEARTFEFTATLPETGAASEQNELQGATTTVACSWTASEAEEEEGEGGEEKGGEMGNGGAEAPVIPVPPEGAGGVVPASGALDLTLPKVRAALRHGRLVVWANCSFSCRLSVRGRVSGTAGGAHRGARLRLTKKRLHPAGRQRLRIPIPPGLRRWLRETPGHERLRARLRFLAVGTNGERDAAHKTVRVRVR